jgi:hypothetical protein
MQTSANVSRPPPDAALTRKDQPGENRQCAGAASRRFTDRPARLDCDCGRQRLQLNRYLAEHSTRHFSLDPTADVTVKNDSTVVLL